LVPACPFVVGDAIGHIDIAGGDYTRPSRVIRPPRSRMEGDLHGTTHATGSRDSPEGWFRIA